MKYLKCQEGVHFYQVGQDSVLHVLCNIGKDLHHKQVVGNIIVESTTRGGSYLINNIDPSTFEFSNRSLVESDEREFSDKLRLCIFELGIYEHAVGV